MMKAIERRPLEDQTIVDMPVSKKPGSAAVAST
jgi:hypothetical protein